MTENHLDLRESMSARTSALTLVALAVLVVGSFALVTLVALPLTALILGEASPWSLAAGALAALGVTVTVVARYRRSVRNPARLRFDSGGLRRSIDGQSFSVRWSEIAWLGIVHNSIAGDVVVIEPTSPATLTPDTKRGSKQKRQNQVIHGGEVVLPLDSTGLSAVELDERIAALSGGQHRVERRQAPKGGAKSS